jgi:hypothetical protein
MNNFIYILNKFNTEQEQRDFERILYNFSNNIPPDEKSDKDYVDLIKDFNNKVANDKHIFIDPLKPEVKDEILQKLNDNTKKIKYP